MDPTWDNVVAALATAHWHELSFRERIRVQMARWTWRLFEIAGGGVAKLTGSPPLCGRCDCEPAVVRCHRCGLQVGSECLSQSQVFCLGCGSRFMGDQEQEGC